MAKTEYVVTANHPVDLTCGQMVGPGDVTDKVDEKSDHDQQLIEEGALSEKPKAEKSTSGEGGKDQSK